MSDDARRDLEGLADDLASAAADGHDTAEDLHGQVNEYLANPDPSPEDHEALHDQLSDGLLHFEVSHPSLSGAMQRVIDSLSASGI
jgi:hypothetical protein